MLIDDVSAPKTMTEALSILKRRPDSILWAGGTLLLTTQAETANITSRSVLDLGGLDELKNINRTERYLELGACVPLSVIISLPSSLSLEPLRSAADLVSTAIVRNLATIGGNIAARHAFMTCFPALVCMDASIEIKGPNSTYWAGLNALVGGQMQPLFPKASMLSLIRIPTQPWDASTIKPLGNPEPGAYFSSSFAAAVRFEKESISEFRLAVAGKRFVRDRALELSFIGKKLPLSAKDIEVSINNARAKVIEAGFSSNTVLLYTSYLSSFLSALHEDVR